jgi:hypothetical protein
MHVQEEKRLVQFLRSNGTTVWRDGESSENDVQLPPGEDRSLIMLKLMLTQIKQFCVPNQQNDHNKRDSYKWEFEPLESCQAL